MPPRWLTVTVLVWLGLSAALFVAIRLMLS
jgi:hypothetical protein